MAINDFTKLTREEFGHDLFACIQQCSERAWIRKAITRMAVLEVETITLLQYGPQTKAQLREHEAALTKSITKLLPKLTPEDATRIFVQYEHGG